MKGSTLALVIVGALVLGFVGGIVGGRLFSKGSDTSALETRLDDVESKISSLEDQLASLPQGPGLKVAYVDAESLFVKVFLPQVEAERQAMAQKQGEIQNLQARYLQGELTQDQYQQQVAKLQVELLQAQLNVDLTMLDKMIASPGFVNFRGDLERIREQARPLVDEVKDLLQTAQLGIVDMEVLLALESSFKQLDQLLTQAAAAKIVEIAQQVAKEKGFDLVLRKKDVLIYRNEETVTDISGDVEGRLWGLFSS
ncbi:OmpH family outer membrane protein [Candidatus Bipolaricaulota bacterium]|nr:OmpH family outer membrane protein [Candidatus Bipolaricaulota bacterium]